MNLFDEVERTDYDGALYTDPRFTYLNRTARPEFANIRSTLEVWFSHYPLHEQGELRKRFRSLIDHHHQAAFFELFLHELLLRLGCQVSLHPIIPSTAKAPDFLVEAPNEERFYLEATLATNESAKASAARARLNAVYDVLNRRVDSTNFFLWLEVEGAPATPPPATRIASFLNQQLARLDPDEITKLYVAGGIHALPQWLFHHDGWRIVFKPIPKKPEARGRMGAKPIGAMSTGVRSVDHRTPLRDAITTKAGRYGELDLPYIVAVNSLEFIDDIDIMEALFGKEQYLINWFRDTDLIEGPQMSRLPDGAWIGPNGPQYTRVSAVLLVNRLLAWNIPQVSLRLYHHPWSKKRYQSVLTRLPQAILKENRMEYSDGEMIGAILGLLDSWFEERN